MNEHEYLYLIRMNDMQAMYDLIQYFRPMVTQMWADSFLYKTKNIICEKEEFYSFADYLLYQCVYIYRNDTKITFRYYYRKCLKNKSFDIIRRYMRKSCYDGMYFKSLDQKIKEDSKLYYRDMCCVSGINVNEQIVKKTQLEYIKKEIAKQFGADALEIFELRLEGYTLDFISEHCYLSRSSVRNLLQKIKNWIAAIDS